MDENNIEKLWYAFELIRSIKHEIEESGKHKRIVKRLDNSLSELQIAIENISAVVDGKDKR